MVTCQTCGAENRAEAKVCRLCSVPLQPAAEQRSPNTEKIDTESTIVFQVSPVVCPVCNAENEDGWLFCQACGAKLKQPQTAPKQLPAQEQLIAPGKIQFHEAIDSARPPQQAADMKTIGSGSLASTCPKCSSHLPPRSRHCPACGTEVPVDHTEVPVDHTPVPADHTVAMASYRPGQKARLRLIVDDGKPGEEFELGDQTGLGRVKGDITFPDDDYMSGRHARIVRKGNQYWLSDEGSRNGTFIRITGDVELKPGDMILVGKQLFLFEL
jgi:predicted amidophosphoribosyltransferase